MLDLKVIGSSSKGNCYIITAGGERLIIECGFTLKVIQKALNFDYSNVVGVLVSHEHNDHSKAVKDLADVGFDVYSSQGTFDALYLKGYRFHSIESLKQFRLGGFTVLPFSVEHDCAEPLGFLKHHPEFGKLLFATDTFYIRYKFTGLNYIMIECNYSKEILEHNIEAGKIPEILRNRLISSHFSLANVKEFLKANDLSQVREIMLIHLSDGNSNAKQFKKEIIRLTGKPVRVL